MLPRDRAPGVHADLHDLPRSLLHSCQLIAVPSIEQQVGVQVAVACVEHVRHRQLVALSDLPDPGQHLRKTCARYRRVLDDEIRGDTSHRPEGLLATLPERGARLLRLCRANLPRSGCLAQRDGCRDLLVETCLDAVEFHDERRAGVDGIAGSESRGLDGPDGLPVDDLESGGQEPGADDLRHRLSGRLDLVEDRQQGPYALRNRHESNLDLRGDTEASLRSHEEADEVVSPLLPGRAPDPDDIAPVGDDREPGDVPGGHAVLQAVRSARVLRDVAPEGTCALR